MAFILHFIQLPERFNSGPTLRFDKLSRMVNSLVSVIHSPAVSCMSDVRIQDVVLKTYLGRWTIGRSGERGSGISVLPARYDDDDESIPTLTLTLTDQRRATRFTLGNITTSPSIRRRWEVHFMTVWQKLWLWTIPWVCQKQITDSLSWTRLGSVRRFIPNKNVRNEFNEEWRCGWPNYRPVGLGFFL